MNTFAHAGGFTLYHYVQLSDNPRYPYGLCGPFATKDEANDALELIIATFPAADFSIERAGFEGKCSRMLSQANAKARQRLEQLRA